MAQHTNNHDAHHNTATSSTMPVVTLVDVNKGKPIRLQVKVMVPVHDHPNYNFVGKLLGPKGNSLKWLQEQTQTKMAILGRGSMRNKDKERQLRELNDVKHNHLNEDLHVEITAFAHPAEAYSRISRALLEIKRFLVPDYYDDIRQQQLRELGVIRDTSPNVNDLVPCPLGVIMTENATHNHHSESLLSSPITMPDLSGSGLTSRVPSSLMSTFEACVMAETLKSHRYKHKQESEDYHNLPLLPPFKRKP